MPQDLSRVPWPVRTERLVIRPATGEDAEATWRFRRLPEVGEWITHAPTDPTSYAENFRSADRLASTLVVELGGPEGAVVGDLMLRVDDAWSQGEVREQAVGVQAELGWVLSPDHVGQGYATEAVAALIEVCFTHLGLRRVVAEAFADNVASWRLMERVGMRREAHTVRDALHRSRGWVDGVYYALLADEWRAT